MRWRFESRLLVEVNCTIATRIAFIIVGISGFVTVRHCVYGLPLIARTLKMGGSDCVRIFGFPSNWRILVISEGTSMDSATRAELNEAEDFLHPRNDTGFSPGVDFPHFSLSSNAWKFS